MSCVRMLKTLSKVLVSTCENEVTSLVVKYGISDNISTQAKVLVKSKIN